MTLLRYTIIFGLLAISIFCLVLVCVDPRTLVDDILHLASMDGYATQILERMQWSTSLRWLLGLESLMSIGLIFFVPTILSNGTLFLSCIQSKIRHQFQKWSPHERWITFLGWMALIVAHWILLSRYTVLEDEAFGMVHFISKGFFTVLGYYPGPNNHVLYNLMVWVLYKAGLSAFWSLKMPSFVATHVFLALFYFMFRFRWGWKMIMLGVCMLLGNELFFSYTLLGRGYLWLTLGAWVALVGVAYDKPDALPFRVGCFVLGSWIAFASVPSYLFCFIGLSLYLGWNVLKTKQWKPWVLGCFVLVFCTSLFYLPISIVNPWGDIFQNSWVKSMDSADWAKSWTMYTKHIILEVLPLSIPAFMVGKWPWSKHSVGSKVLWLCMVGGACMVLFVQKVWPFDRVWIYFSVVWVVMVGEGIIQLKLKSLQWVLVGMLSVFHVNIFFNTLNDRWNSDDSHIRLAHKIILAPFPIITNETTLYTYMLYAHLETNGSTRITYGEINQFHAGHVIVAKSNSTDDRWLNTHQKVYSSKLVDIFAPKNTTWKIQ